MLLRRGQRADVLRLLGHPGRHNAGQFAGGRHTDVRRTPRDGLLAEPLRRRHSVLQEQAGPAARLDGRGGGGPFLGRGGGRRGIRPAREPGAQRQGHGADPGRGYGGREDGRPRIRFPPRDGFRQAHRGGGREDRPAFGGRPVAVPRRVVGRRDRLRRQEAPRW